MRTLILAAALLLATGAPAEASGGWRVARIAPVYGPGLYGRVMACGGILTRHTRGVTSRTARCGRRIELSWGGRTVITRVVDRGPYPIPSLYAAMPFDLAPGTSCWDLMPGGRYGHHGCFTKLNVRYRWLGR